MRISCSLGIVIASMAMLHLGASEAAAQVEIGGSATVNNIRGGTFGLGGRLGVNVRESMRFGVRLEGAVDYFWPSCPFVDCDAIGTRLDLIFQNRLSGRTQGYFGFGGAFQSYTLENNNETVDEGDGWGFNMVAGSRYQGQGTRPFVEVSWTLMDEIDNQWAFTVGTTLVLGR